VIGQVEILIDADGGVFLDTGDRWEGLRVRYRTVGERRWAKFILVGAEGQSLRDLLDAAVAVVARSDSAGIAHPTRASCEQLQLGGAAA
jgi:hypothetical protein